MAAILVFIETQSGKPKKQALEAASYGSEIAAATGAECIGVALGTSDDSALSSLGAYGIRRVIKVEDGRLDQFSSQAVAAAVAQVASHAGADTVVFSQSLNGKAAAPRVAVRMEAGIVSGAVALPDSNGGFTVKKSAFSGKAFTHTRITSDRKVVSIVPNSFGVRSKGSDTATLEQFNADLPDTYFRVRVKEVRKQQGDSLPLPEAELVVSGGRGLKGPENWGIIEDLAASIGASTACSRPVSDVGWRPHHEHVGQTGIAIRPNLYIAVGISGAIQHLAGVNQSKVIVVINKDPEAPFFKAADYGIVGDAFDVVPKLTEALTEFRAAHA